MRNSPLRVSSTAARGSRIMNKNTWKSLLEKARKGDSNAQCDAGIYYAEGFDDAKGQHIVFRNPAKAVYWYRLSAEQGNSVAQNQLGVCLSVGIGTARNVQQAISWTKKAFAQGDASAAHNLATIYRDMGQYKKSYKLYSRAAAMGEMDSLLEVGLSLYYGVGVNKDRKAACKCYQKLIRAEQNAVTESSREDAYYMLGIAHLEGSGVSRSIAKARILFEKANKDEDHRSSQLMLILIGRNKFRRK